MALNILDAATLAAVAAADNQEDQAAALAAAWGGGNVTARVFAGATLLATLTHAPWALSTSTTPRRLTLGARQARTFVAIGVPTKVVFRAGSTDIFELTAGVGSGDVSFAASITNPAMERIDGLVITALASLPAVPTLNLPSNAPNRVVVESWASGSAVDVGTITLDTLIRADRFADANLAADCAGWLEYGPASASGLPVLDGVQFSAKGFDIRAGGVYGQRSYRVMVMMRAIGNNTSGQPLVDGLFGDVRGVNHYPGPHKLRILSVSGTVLKTVEMRDGLPINHASLVNCPFDWTVTSRPSGTAYPNVAHVGVRLPAGSPMRPWMAAGSTYVAMFGDEPQASTNTRNRIPRVDASLWISKNTKVRSIYGGDDVHLYDPNYGGNGNAHPEIMPQWPMSKTAAEAITTVVQHDTEILYGVQGYNWINALRVGWGYEPGALGGITRRGGPGGQRMDRSLLPSEIAQMALTQAQRVNDNQPTEPMARGYALNHANYPCYYPTSMTTLDAANHFSSAVQFPNAGVAGGDVLPVFHYYGNQEGLSGQPNAVWIGDTYGPPPGPVEQVIEWGNPSTGAARSTHPGHVRNGWTPDSEHVNRMGAAWATLQYADPMFARMAEHLMLENQMMWSGLAKTSYAGHDTTPNLIAQCWNISHSRTAILPFAGAAMAWWSATTAGVYKRSEIEAKIHAWAALHAADLRANFTATTTNATHRAFAMTGGLPVTWKTWSANGNYAAGSGWVATIGIYTVYLSQWLMILKSSGLWAALRTNATTATWLDDMVRQIEFVGRMTAAAPWAVASAGAFDAPSFILRSAAAGGVQATIDTVPTSVADCITHNPALRGDALWFLKAADISGATPAEASGSGGGSFNYAGWARLQIAHTYWAYFAPAGSDRTAGLAQIETRISALRGYSVTVYDAGFTRFNSPQAIPALAA